MNDFVQLHTHTHFSILQSFLTPKDLLTRAKELGQQSIAITDHGTFAGIWDAWKVSKEVGIKLIVGCEFYFVDDIENTNGKYKYVVLLAINHQGYKNLLLLNKSGYDHQFFMMKKVIPVIDWSLLEKHSDGVICLTGCANGILGSLINEKKFEEAENTIQRLHKLFGDNFGIEVQTHNTVKYPTTYFPASDQNFTNIHSIRLAKKYNVRVVPTSNVYYLNKEEAASHDVLLAIGAGQPIYSNNRIKFNTTDLYIKTDEEVKGFFARNNGEEFAKEICANTSYFANKCEVPEWIVPKYSNPTGNEYPVFKVEQEDDYQAFLMWRKLQNEKVQKCDVDAAFLRFRCEKALREKTPKGQEKSYSERLEEELNVLEKQGFSSYMLITADFLNWARKQGISVGAGRGSVGGSIIGYVLDIHKADPIKYGLMFARFQNKDRSTPPDCDNDISTFGRERVIDYLKDKYGRDNIVAISNFAKITPKVYARDIARACDLANNRKESVDLGNRVAESIPAENKNDLNFTQLKQLPLFDAYCQKYSEYVKHRSVLGSYRNVAAHAAGFILGRRKLTDLVPLRRDKDGNITIEYEKERSEENGLLKVDILGLTTLDLVDNTINLIKKSGKQLNNDYINYDKYDKPTYDLISSGNTYGVFQLGVSAGMIALCKQIKPKSIEDLAIITTIGRPACKDIRKLFIDTRDGKRPYKLLHPSLKNAFEATLGFGLYDESMLKVAQDVAGWDLNRADRIRKMIKEKGKHPEKTEKLRKEFIEGAILNKIPQSMAVKIWDEVIAVMGSYTFNKSHAVLYSFLSYTTAYLKAHYPIEFLLANLMAEVRSGAKIAAENIDKIKQELRQYNVKILPPDLNKSNLTYELIDEKTLLTGLDALKFVGDDAIKDIIEKRPFKSFDDFMLRVDTSKVRANTIQALVATGCLDSFGISRKLMYLYCSDYRKKLQVWLKKHDPSNEIFEYPWPVENDWSMSELYALEKLYLGEAFVCGKQKAYGNFFNRQCVPFSIITEMANRDKVESVIAEIKSIFELKVKKVGSKFLGQSMLKATIEDVAGKQMSLTIFPKQWKDIKIRVKDLHCKFEPGYAIHLSGSINTYDDDLGIILDDLYDICPPPKTPANLKARKVIVKKLATEENLKPIDIDQTDKIVEDIEDTLFNEGSIDFEDENDDFGLI